MFKPPDTCVRCQAKPHLGDSLFHTGELWLCAGCLTDDFPGEGLTNKVACRELQSNQQQALSRRARVAGDIDGAVVLEEHAQWHMQAAMAVYDHGSRIARQSNIANGEAAPAHGYLRDTLQDPDLIAVESSEARGRLVQQNDVIALGVDIAKTVNASNTAEKLIAHEIAVAHRVAMQQAAWAITERDPKMEIKRLQVSARMMTTAQEGLLTLQKLKATGPQSVTVQHVHVNDGGQAVVGNVHAKR